MSETSLFLFSYAPLPAPVTIMNFHPFVSMSLLRLTVRLMFTVRFLYPSISFLPLSAINTHFHYAEINSGSKKTHTKASGDSCGSVSGGNKFYLSIWYKNARNELIN